MSDGRIKHKFSIGITNQDVSLTIIDPFTITLSGEVKRTFEDGKVVFQITMLAKEEGDKPDAVGTIEVPLTDTTRPVDLIELEQYYKKNFMPRLRDALAWESILHLQDAINLAIADARGIDAREVIGTHLEETAKRLRTWFDVNEESRVERRGHRSEWTPLGLAWAIEQAMRTIEHKRDLNYEKVAERLRTMYGDKSPASGAALKKLVARFKVNWKMIKRDSEKRFSVTTK